MRMAELIIAENFPSISYQLEPKTAYLRLAAHLPILAKKTERQLLRVRVEIEVATYELELLELLAGKLDGVE